MKAVYNNLLLHLMKLCFSVCEGEVHIFTGIWKPADTASSAIFQAWELTWPLHSNSLAAYYYLFFWIKSFESQGFGACVGAIFCYNAMMYRLGFFFKL